MTAYERVMARCVRVGRCLIYRTANNGNGYARTSDRGVKKYVHRIVYEHYHGPIQPGLDIDHVKSRGCTSRACCEIRHLEAVTPTENKLRGSGFSAVNARKTHCSKGHPLVPKNLRTYEFRQFRQRSCRVCFNANRRAKRAAA